MVKIGRGVLCKRPRHATDFPGEESRGAGEGRGRGDGKAGLECRIIPDMAADNVCGDDEEKDKPKRPVGVNEVDEDDCLELAEVAGEVEVLRQVSVVEKLEADVVEGHCFVQAPVAEEVARVGEPPLHAAPEDAVVGVAARAEAAELLLELEVAHKVHLLHVAPAAREGERGEDGDEDDDGVDDGEEEDEDVGKLEAGDGLRGRVHADLVRDEDEGDEAEDHELSVEIAEDGLQMEVARRDPFFQLVEGDLEEERDYDEGDEEIFGED